MPELWPAAIRSYNRRLFRTPVDCIFIKGRDIKKYNFA